MEIKGGKRLINETNGGTLIQMLDKLPDPRDNRGKRHNLSFVPQGEAKRTDGLCDSGNPL